MKNLLLKNKKSFFVFLCIALWLHAGLAQQPAGTSIINHNPEKLKYPDERVRKFVNFSFITFMAGLPATVNNDKRNWGGVPTQFQICYPYSLFRKKFPIAVGINIGISRMGFQEAALSFSNNELTGITADASIKRALQRHWHTGFSILKTIKISQPLRMLVGPSFLINYGGRLRQSYKSAIPTVKVNTSNAIKRLSVPIQIQAGYSTKQFASIGVWLRVPTGPVFKGAAYSDLKQFNMGMSVALIF